MRLAVPNFVRHLRLLVATIVAIVIASITTFAQVGSFTAPFEGQLWRVQQELSPVDGSPVGSVFTATRLYVADQDNSSVVAYDKTTWAVIDLPNADWNKTGVVGNPAFGLLPNEMNIATVLVNAVSIQAILVSDLNAPRVLAFRTDGTHLFTLQLDHPGTTSNDTNPLINGVAMGPGASFTLTTGAAPALSLTGAFAAGWTNAGRIHGAALAYRNIAFVYNNSTARFSATPTAVLDGTEAPGVGPASYETYGVVFDAAGNLYTTDTATERINVYDSTTNFTHRFRFGTPAPDNGVAEFSQPFGLAFWPDANGGLLFVGDVLNNRVAVYRPNIAGNTLTYVSSIDRLPPAVDPQLFSISIDPATGLIAVSDFTVPTVWVMKTADLVAYNVQLLDAGGVAIDSVCAGASYRLRFTVTVPAGHVAADGVVPTLTIGGQVVSNGAILGQPSGNPRRIQPLNTATYTYDLTMSGTVTEDQSVVAGATATSTTDVLAREGTIAVGNCSASNAPPQVALSSTIPAQVSGWFPVYDQPLSLTLTATDDRGVKLIEYKLNGTNDLGATNPPVAFSATNTTESVVVPMPEDGISTVEYRARDSQNVWSAWQTREIRIVRVANRQSNEGTQDTFTIGNSVGTGYVFSATGLPPGVSINPSTGQISAQLLYSASGVYPVTMTESLGSQSSSYTFTWTVLDVNRHPTITPINPASLPPIIEGQPFELHVQGSDPDGDRTVFTVTGSSVPLGHALPGGSISIDPVTGLISGTFPLNSHPIYLLTVALAECNGTSDSDPAVCAGIQPRTGLATVAEITVNVTNKNQPPTIISPGARTNAEGDTITPLQIAFSDPDFDRADDVDFEVDNLPPGLTMDLETGLITGTVLYTAGTHTYPVVVRARDQEGVRPLPFITFNWTITNVNSPPVPTHPGNLVNNEGQSISRQFTATDIDASDTLTFSAAGLPTGLTMSPTGLVTGNLSYTTAGSYSVTVTVNDGTTTRTMMFTWIINNVNRPPNVVNPGPQSAAEGATISLPISASDPDAQTLTYKVSGLPAQLSINPATGVISGVLSSASAGTYTVTVTATDPESAFDFEVFTFTVANTNLAPVAVNDLTSATQGQPTVLNVLANDSDEETGTTLKIIAVTSPSVGTVSITNGGANVTYTAPPTYLGAPATFYYTITDGSLTAKAMVTVNIRSSNQAPVCSAAYGGEIWPPNHKRFYVAPISGVTDPDGNPVSIRIDGIWQDEPVDSTGDGNFSPDGYIEGGKAWVRAERAGHGNKATGDGRVYEILFTAMDNKGGQCTGSVMWTVPHDKGQRSTAIDSGLRYDSTNVIPGARNKSQIHQNSLTPQ
jgi:hypothetical protein